MATPPETVAAAIRAWRSHSDPLVVAVDGHGASGKSTLADGLRRHLDLAIVHTDDFFRAVAEQPAAEPERPMFRYYDLERLRREALEPLLRGEVARFQAFDEQHDRLREEQVEIAPAGVVLIEGVSSAAPELAELVQRTIFVHTPLDKRIERLRMLISREAWDEQWLEAELRYFKVLGPGSFDLTVSGS